MVVWLNLYECVGDEVVFEDGFKLLNDVVDVRDVVDYLRRYVIYFVVVSFNVFVDCLGNVCI